MGKPSEDLQPWDSTSCDLDECRRHILWYRHQYERMSVRRYVAAFALGTAAAAALLLDARPLAAALAIVAAYCWMQSRRHTDIVNLLAALWPLALVRSTRE
jgi:hypothetical protein